MVHTLPTLRVAAVFAACLTLTSATPAPPRRPSVPEAPASVAPPHVRRPAPDADGRAHRPGVVGRAVARQVRPAARRARPVTPTAARVTMLMRQTPPGGNSGSGVVAFALAQVGDAYVWGGAGPDGWDCSGLVAGAYATVGVWLPHQSGAMLHSPRVQRIPRGAMQPGDLVWPHPGHVAIYLGRGRIVHAATPAQGVRVDPLYAFMAAARVR